MPCGQHKTMVSVTKYGASLRTTYLPQERRALRAFVAFSGADGPALLVRFRFRDHSLMSPNRVRLHFVAKARRSRMQHWGWLCTSTLLARLACLGPCIVTSAIVEQLQKLQTSHRCAVAVFVTGPVTEKHVQLGNLQMQTKIVPERELECCLRGNDLALDVAQASHKPLIRTLRVDELAVVEHELGVVLRSAHGRMQSVKTSITNGTIVRTAGKPTTKIAVMGRTYTSMVAMYLLSVHLIEGSISKYRVEPEPWEPCQTG